MDPPRPDPLPFAPSIGLAGLRSRGATRQTTTSSVQTPMPPSHPRPQAHHTNRDVDEYLRQGLRRLENGDWPGAVAEFS